MFKVRLKNMRFFDRTLHFKPTRWVTTMSANSSYSYKDTGVNQ